MSEIKYYNDTTKSVLSLASFLFMFISTFLNIRAHWGLTANEFSTGFFSRIALKSEFELVFIWTIIAYFMLLSFRILLGLIFIFNDESYNEDKVDLESLSGLEKEKYDKRKKKAQAWEFFLITPMIVMALILINIFWSLGFYEILIVALVIHALILFFNIIFYERLFKKDVERKSNIFIAVGDVASFLIPLALFFDCLYDSRLFYGFFGGFLLVFIGEFLTQYFNSLKLAKNKISNILKTNYEAIRAKIE